MLDNICDIIGTILELVPMYNHVNQFSATYGHKLHYKSKSSSHASCLCNNKVSSYDDRHHIYT